MMYVVMTSYTELNIYKMEAKLLEIIFDLFSFNPIIVLTVATYTHSVIYMHACKREYVHMAWVLAYPYVKTPMEVGCPITVPGRTVAAFTECCRREEATRGHWIVDTGDGINCRGK
jgi:hypothetical protein